MDRSSKKGDEPGKGNNKSSETERRFRENQRLNDLRTKRLARRNALKANLLPEVIDALGSVDKINAAAERAKRREIRNGKRSKVLDEIKAKKANRISEKTKGKQREFIGTKDGTSSSATYQEMKVIDDYTNKNTLGLTIEQYIDRAGEAKLPDIQYNDAETWNRTLEAFLKNDGQTKALFLDFDGTMARFTDTAAQTLAVKGFLSSINKLVDKGYKVAIITGRAMEGDGGILPALRRSGADDKLLNRLEIFASHGSQQRGSDTNWEVKETQEMKEQVEQVKKNYGELNKQLRASIQQRIDENETLKDFKIEFDPKEPVGYTIHYRQVEESMHQQVSKELETLLAKIMPEEKTQKDFSLMEDEIYKPFTYRSATKSFEILLNEETTGIDLSKGAVVKIFAEKWGVKVGIAFGDDKTDLKMQKWLKVLEDAGKLLQAYVGIYHANSPSEIKDQSTIVLKEQKDTRPWAQEMSVGLVANLAERAPKQQIEGLG